jgi:hypothetical protein
LFKFNIECIPLIIIGMIFIVFAKKISNAILSFLPNHRFNKQPYKSLLYIWPIRLMGVMCLVFAFIFFGGIPDYDSNRARLVLLEKGQITEAQVEKVIYRKLAPEGWEVVYKFSAKDPKTNTKRLYDGSSQGPKSYYHFSKGDAVEVIYNPQNPKINCEIKRFLNHPSYRNTFEKAGKLQLLGRFKNKYELETYTFHEWYSLQQTNN